MREHIARLEMRIKELENLDQTSPSITLFDPHAPSPYYSGSSSSSSHGSPSALSLPASVSPTPFPQGERGTPRAAMSPLTACHTEVDLSWESQWELAVCLLALAIICSHLTADSRTTRPLTTSRRPTVPPRSPRSSLPRSCA